MNYQAIGKKIVNVDGEEQRDVAVCDDPAAAIAMMIRAHYLNDVKRQYTNAARMFFKIECLPGFQWIEPK